MFRSGKAWHRWHIVDYRHFKRDIAEFKDYLRSGPGFDDLDVSRTTEGARSIDWAGEQRYDFLFRGDEALPGRSKQLNYINVTTEPSIPRPARGILPVAGSRRPLARRSRPGSYLEAG
jgi:hypothetical protein